MPQAVKNAEIERAISSFFIDSGVKSGEILAPSSLILNNQRYNQRSAGELTVSEVVDCLADITLDVGAVGAGIFFLDAVVGGGSEIADIADYFVGFVHVHEAAGDYFRFAGAFLGLAVDVDEDNESAVLRHDFAVGLDGGI